MELLLSFGASPFLSTLKVGVTFAILMITKIINLIIMPMSFLAHPEGGNLDLSLHLHNQVDTMSFGSSAQKGCYCALSTAASHGQRKVSLRYFSKTEICIFMENYFRKALHKLVTHPTTLTSQNSGREVIISKLDFLDT